jgi:hypothetical protein
MVSINFSSEGAKASEVDRILKQIGFLTTLGENDYVYKWDKEEAANEEDYKKLEVRVINLIDQVQARLKGAHVYLRFRTIRSL